MSVTSGGVLGSSDQRCFSLLELVNSGFVDQDLMEEVRMYIENYRSLVQGILILVLTAVAYWVSLPIGLGLLVGLGLLAFMRIMKLQESRTNWCPSDPVFKIMGIKKRAES